MCAHALTAQQHVFPIIVALPHFENTAVLSIAMCVLMYIGLETANMYENVNTQKRDVTNKRSNIYSSSILNKALGTHRI